MKFQLQELEDFQGWLFSLPDFQEAKALEHQARQSEAEHAEFLQLQQKHFEELQQSRFWQGLDDMGRQVDRV